MSDEVDPRLALCAEVIGHSFTQTDLIYQALVHRSWQAENDEPFSNERLEFLGDAVLGWAVADIAFHRLAELPEGKLTDLRRSVVNMHALSDIARNIGLGDFILLGKGEDAAGGRDKSSILADALEALIGAVYLDGGAQKAFAVVERLLASSIEAAIPNLEAFDSKTRLQELCARLGLGAPGYDTEGVGPDHERVFTAYAIVNGKNIGAGTGRTKKAAEQVAAHVAFESLTNDA
jgi:ribonuclease-3